MSRIVDEAFTAEAKIARLRNALIGVVGADDMHTLDKMELCIRSTKVPFHDKEVTLEAIDTLRWLLLEEEKNARV